MKILLFIFCLLSVNTLVCCQSEETSVRDRLVGYWESERVLVDGQETPGKPHIQIQQEEYRRVFEEGSWELNEHEDTIVFVPDSDGMATYSAEIRKLTNDELWLSRTINGQLQEEYYVKKK